MAVPSNQTHNHPDFPPLFLPPSSSVTSDSEKVWVL